MARTAKRDKKTLTEGRQWAEALRQVVERADAKRLRAIAEKLVEKAEGGDLAAIKELGDRLDGKTHQAPAGELQASSVTVEVIRFADMQCRTEPKGNRHERST